MATIKPRQKLQTVIWALLWGATYIGSVYLLKYNKFNIPVSLLLTAAPVVLFIVYVYSYIRQIASMDEVKQRMHFEAVVIGFSLSLLLVLILFMLQTARILADTFFSYGFLIGYFMLFYLIGFFISKRKYAA